MNGVQPFKGAEGFIDELTVLFSLLRHKLPEVVGGAYEGRRVEDEVRRYYGRTVDGC